MHGHGRRARAAGWLLLLLCTSTLPVAAAEKPAAPPLTPEEIVLQDDATLHDVSFVGPSLGFAVGTRGTVRKTTDGGQTWELLPTPVACDWKAVQFLTDRIGWIAGGAIAADGRTTQGCVLATRDGGESWTIQAPIDLGYIQHLQFFDLSHGIICGEPSPQNPSGIWRTADGGKSWRGVTHPRQFRWLAGSFTDHDSGVLVGEQGRVALFGGNQLFLDPGINWGHKAIRSVAVDDSARGWLVGQGGLIRFSPGGAAWQDPPREIPEELQRIMDFHDVAFRGDSVWMVGHPGSAILKSNDGGQTWQMVPTPSTVPLNAITFVDDSHGYAVGELGTIVKTTDGGNSWQLAGGPSRRLALLQFATVPDEASFSLIARYSGHHGYRTGIVALSPGEQDSAPEAVAQSLRLEAATQISAGNSSLTGWTLPLDLPELRGNQQQLIARWNQATDGQLSEQVLIHLVRDLRTYRPTVVVIDAPVDGDQAGLMMQQALENAIRMAGDSTAVPQLKTMTGLDPWPVARVVLRNRAGQGGDVVLDNSQYLPRLKQSVRSAAVPAFRMTSGPEALPPMFESYKVSSMTPVPQNLRMQDLFTGIVLGPGSDARRVQLPTDETDRRGEEVARRQRNLHAYVKKNLSEEQTAAQTVAQLNDFVRGMTPQQATTQLYELACEYRTNHDWDYCEAVLSRIVEDYPAQPLAGTAARELIQLWSSREMRQLRLQGRGAGKLQNEFQASSPFGNTTGVEQVAGQEFDDSLPPVTPAVTTSEVTASISSGSRQEKSAWETTWRKRALALYEFLKADHPQVAATAEVQFSLAALLREQGADRAANELYGHFLLGQELDERQIRNPRLRIAEGEFWLQSQDGLPPGTFSLCLNAKSPPRLNGEISEECWATAEELRLKTTVGQPSLMNASVEETPIVLCTFDEEYFYLAGRFPRRPNLPADLPSRGGRHYDADLSGYDRLQFSIDVDRDYQTAYVFEVDQRGYTRDRCGQDESWNPEWYVACDGDQESWQVEIAIPRAQLEPPGRERNPVWAVSLSRILPGEAVQSWNGQTTAEPQFGAIGLLRLQTP